MMQCVLHRYLSLRFGSIVLFFVRVWSGSTEPRKVGDKTKRINDRSKSTSNIIEKNFFWKENLKMQKKDEKRHKNEKSENNIK